MKGPLGFWTFPILSKLGIVTADTTEEEGTTEEGTPLIWSNISTIAPSSPPGFQTKTITIGSIRSSPVYNIVFNEEVTVKTDYYVNSTLHSSKTGTISKNQSFALPQPHDRVMPITSIKLTLIPKQE